MLKHPPIITTVTKRACLCCLVFLFFVFGPLAAQPPISQDSTSLGKLSPCGATCDHFKSHAVNPPNNTNQLVIPATFPSSATLTCGKIKLYFEDMLPTSPAAGFNDPISGSTRRNTFCAVLNYIQSIFDFSNISASNPVRILVEQSYAPAPGIPAPSGTGWIGRGSPSFWNNPNTMIYGWLRDYVVTGTDPVGNNYSHGTIKINFDGTWQWDNISQTLISVPADIYNGTTVTGISNCQYDLYSILLHEMGHNMGWFGLVEFPISNALSIVQPIGNTANIYSAIDHSIRVGAVGYPSNSFTKLIGNSGALTSIGVGANNNYWLDSSSAPDNLPVFSGYSGNGNFDPGFQGSYISHLDDQLNSYTFRQRISPGDAQEFVMGPFSIKGVQRRSFVKGEIQAFKNILGYTLLSSWQTANPYTIPNHVPFSTRVITPSWNAGYYATYGSGQYSADPGDKVPVDYTLINNTGASLTIALNSDPRNIDADGDPIFIAENTLVNFRGCGNGGNNHAQLTISPDRKSITYTPRPNFYGRAQFGFNLYDGKEKGAFVIYTIDVKRGSNVTLTAGQYVLNGGFEEGSEVKVLGAQENIPNASMTQDNMREGKFSGIHYADSHPGTLYSGWWGTAIRNSFFECSAATVLKEQVGYPVNSFPNSYRPNSVPGTGGNRYSQAGSANYSYLAADLQHCKKYVLEFDLYNVITTVPWELTYGFSNDTAINWPAMNISNAGFNSGLWGAYPNLLDKKSYTGSLIPQSWNHISIPFFYCGNDPSNILFLTDNYGSSIDNLSIKEDTSKLHINVTQTFAANCQQTQLQVTGSNIIAACDSVHYRWSPTVGLSCTDCADPVATNTSPVTYTVVVTNGCQSDSVTLLVLNGLPTHIAATTSCAPAALSVTPTGAGYIYNWSGPLGGNSTTLSATLPGVYTVTVTAPSGCTGTDTISLSPAAVCCNTAISHNPSTTVIYNGTATDLLARFNNPSGNTIQTNNYILIDGIFTVDQNITFRNCPNIVMGAGAKMAVNPNQTLSIIENTKLKAICPQLWWGIDASNARASVVIKGNSELWHMENGIRIENGAKLECWDSKFYDNYTSLYFANTPAGYQGIVKNNTFKTVNNLLAPYNGQKARYGIYARNCQQLNIGDTLQPSNTNTFDNLGTGVYAEVLTFSSGLPYNIGISNNVFKNITGGNFGLVGQYGQIIYDLYNDSYGAAVYAKGQAIVPNQSNLNVVVNSKSGATINHFDNCTKGVLLNSAGGSVTNTRFNNLMWAIASGQADGRNYRIVNNNINNVHFGVDINGNVTIADVKYNTINMTGSSSIMFNGTPIGLPIGICVTNFTTTSTTNVCNIDDNAITVPAFSSVGIAARNWGPTLSMYRNNIKLTTSIQNQPNTPGPVLELTGININNCKGSRIQGNTVTGNIATINTNRSNVSGININKSPNLYLRCNNMSNVRYGFLVVGDCRTADTSVKGNTFESHVNGMLFRHLGTEGSLGNIGAPANDNHNTFSGSYLNTNGSKQKVYQMSVCDSPISYLFFTSPSYLAASESQGNNPGCQYGVSSNTPNATRYNCPVPFYKTTPTEGQSGGNVIDIPYSELIAQNHLTYAEFQELTAWISGLNLYADLSTDTPTRDASAELDSFYLAQYNAAMGHIYKADDGFGDLAGVIAAENELLYAEWLNKVKDATDAIEGTPDHIQNEHDIDDLYIKYITLGRDALTDGDNNLIADLAFQCPYMAGPAVYKARMLWGTQQPGVNYDDLDICNRVGVYKNGGGGLFDAENKFLRDQQPGNIQPSTLLNTLKIYPNPANASVTVECTEQGSLVLFDQLGRQVMTIPANSKTTTFNISRLTVGMYYYQYIVDNIPKYIGKLVVTH